jgi:HAMP domain-containing protein
VMTRPLRHLGHVADTMSKGDLDTPVSVGIESHDEIGDLARSLERMRSSLKAAMSRFSDG